MAYLVMSCSRPIAHYMFTYGLAMGVYLYFVLEDFMKDTKPRYVPKRLRPCNQATQFLQSIPRKPPWLLRQVLVLLFTCIPASTHQEQEEELCSFNIETAHENNIQSSPLPTVAFDTNSFQIRVDNHCSRCISFNKDDFVGPLTPKTIKFKGLAGQTANANFTGTIRWRWEDDLGQIHTHLIEDSVYLPGSQDRILSPQHWIQTRRSQGLPQAGYLGDGETLTLHWGQSVKVIPLDLRTNVAIMQSAPNYAAAFANVVSDDEDVPDLDSDSECSTASEGEESYHLASRPRPITFETRVEPHVIPPDTIMEEHRSPLQLFNYWHHRLNHISPMRMVRMAQAGLLPKSLTKVRFPTCPSCAIGKATRRPWRLKQSTTKQPKRTVPAVTAPGDCVSVDQLQSTTPGLIAQLRGFITKQRYEYATVFVDHYSSLGFLHLQRTSNMIETLQAKEAFEAYAAARGVVIQHYHADNGRFVEKGWTEHCRSKGQTVSYCGVGAHHQNGVAEKRIRDLQEGARAAIIHAKRHWPDAITTNLWPYALRSANNAHNYTISLKHKQLPINRFSQVEETNEMRNFHTFGCPSYALHSELQSGNRRSKHKWGDRAMISINLGPSPRHGKSVNLLLNVTTGIITPQFHVKFDDAFDTCRKGSDVHLPKSLWQQKTYFRQTPAAPTPPVEREPRTTRSSAPIGGHSPTSQLPQPVQAPPPADAPETTVPEGASPSPAPATEPPVQWTQTGRIVKPPTRYEAYISIANYDGTYELPFQEYHPLMMYKATTNPDIMYLDEALMQPDRHEFVKAMLKEVRDHERRGHWKVIPKWMVPPGRRILPAVWSMARKRELLSGLIYKWKSRLTLGGHKQVAGQDYELTFAPVVAWPTIRLFLTYFLMKDWKTRQLDLVLAYPHAKVDRPTFMRIPRGFQFEGSTQRHVLQIIYNLYGGCDAGRIYFLFMAKYLKSVGFKQSSIDPCVFFYKGVILLMFVDDFIIAGQNDAAINEAVELIKDNTDVEDKGEINDYVGVHFTKNKDGTITLTQPQLIQSILKELHLVPGQSKAVATPALSSKVLHADLEGEDFDNHFNYRKVIGKLYYLTKSVRPDIEFSVHQCSRFMANPKQSHAKAIKQIGRYLLATQDKGLILRPDSDKSLDCYVDASFAGEWVRGLEDQAMSDPNTARSRTGFVITYAGVPITWSTKLQLTVATSSTEAEMVALSAATKEVIFFFNLINDANKLGNLDITLNNSHMHITVHEDNQGTIAIAKEYRIRPRTKHINVKYWHYTQFMQKNKDIMSINWVPSEENLADILTKPLGRLLHHRHLRTICGWTHPMSSMELEDPRGSVGFPYENSHGSQGSGQSH